MKIVHLDTVPVYQEEGIIALCGKPVHMSRTISLADGRNDNLPQWLDTNEKYCKVCWSLLPIALLGIT